MYIEDGYYLRLKTVQLAYHPALSLFTDVLPQNVAGVAIAMINSLSAAGAFVGSYLMGYLSGTSGNFGSSFLIMSVALLLSSFLTTGATRCKPPPSLGTEWLYEGYTQEKI